MKVPLLDLKAQYASLRDEIEPVMKEVSESQYFIMGPRVTECEAAVSAYSGAVHGIGVSSGTDALLVSMMALGIGPGDEVITSPYTFFATAGSIVRLGARPVFVDIDPVTFNIRADGIAEKITAHTRVILPVHLFGQVADMDPIMALAGEKGLAVIEDACQAIGAEYKGKRAGAIGSCGCFSFFPSKNLGAFGDGGMVTTNDAGLAEKISWLRNHGMNPKYYHPLVGGNFRLDALQAAIVTIKLKHLDSWTAGRQSNACRYERLFEESGLLSRGDVVLPKAVMDRHIFNQFVVRVPRRDELLAFLKEQSIGVEVYYPVPLHLQECFKSLGYREGGFPESERAARETIALPIYPELTDEQASYVVQLIQEFYSG